eukprot:10829157-Alexandrium_andersonii.AAC.1
MPRQPGAALQERLRGLPAVPLFMPGHPGYEPPMVGSVAAASRPKPKAKLLSYKTVLENQAKARSAAKSAGWRGGAIAGRP